MDSSALDRRLLATVELYENLTNIAWEDGGFVGELEISDNWLDVLHLLEDANILRRIRHQGLSQTVRRLHEGKLNGVVEITVEPPREPKVFFARDLNDLLGSFGFRFSQPDLCYVASLRQLSSAPITAAVFGWYLQALEFVDLVSQCGDHLEVRASVRSVVLLGPEGKLEVPVVYKEEDVRELPGLCAFAQLVHSEPHATANQLLLKAAVRELVSSVAVNERFKALLTRYSELRQNFVNNLELYVSKFSFHSEKEKVEEQKREYLLKLNNTLSDIHTKLIAIPVAVVLVGGQMKQVDAPGVRIANSVLVAGAVVFAVLMGMITLNQRHSLDAVYSEFSAKRKRLVAEFPGLFSQIGTAFTELESRYRHQVSLLRLINGLIAIGLLSSLTLYFYFDPEMRRWIFALQRFVPLYDPLLWVL